MRSKTILLPAVFLLSFIVFPTPDAIADGTQKLSLFGDVRFRVELDRDSRKSDGSMRSDRDRMRMRFRMGFNYKKDERFSFGGRLRSGSSDIQSPDATLGSEFAPKSIHIDQAFLKGSWEGGHAWLGKNSFPFWKQNDLFWDDDITPEGAAVRHQVKLGEKVAATLNAGYFQLDNTVSNEFGNQAHMTGGQVALRVTASDRVVVECAAGGFAFTDNPGEENPRIEDRTWNLGNAGANVQVKNGAKPVKVGFDFVKNFKDYPEGVFNRDQQTGYVVSAKMGRLAAAKEFLIAYYYAHIERFAVVPRLAGDDWLRWSDSGVPGTRSSNFMGHELRAAVALGKKNHMVARFYSVEGIELQESSASARENGKRFRVDWNMAF